MQNLALKYNSNDPIALNIFENYQVVFIPLANPYGIEHLVRFNINGVDLNRNFDYNWSSFSSDVKGDSPFSEVEAQVLRDFFLENVENIILVNDSHSAMQISPGMTWGESLGVNPPKDIASIYSITTAIEPYRWFEERAGVGRWLSYDRYEVQSNKPYFGNWLGSIGLPCSTNEVQGKLDIGTERMIFTSSWYITHFESIFSALSGKVGKTVFKIESIDPIVFTNNVLVEGLIPPESSVNIRYGSNSNQTLPTNFYSDFNAVPENSNLFIEITLNRSAYDNLSPNIDSLKVFYDSVQILPTVTPTVSPTITVTPTVTITVIPTETLIPTATATLTPSPTEVPVTITTTTTISPKPSSNNSSNNAIITPTLSAELDNIDNPLDSDSDLEIEETLPKNSPIVTNVQNNKETLTADSKSNDSNIILTSILLLVLVITSSFVIIFFKKRKSRPSIEKI